VGKTTFGSFLFTPKRPFIAPFASPGDPEGSPAIYSGEYEGVSKEKVIPLVFDTYGGYADETIRFLETIVMGMSKNDDVLAAKLVRNFRNRIAICSAPSRPVQTHQLLNLPWYGEE